MRTTVVLSASAAALFLLAGPASAHVTVHGPEAAQGGFAKITFQVPTEKAIPTTKLEVDFPVDQPLAFVSVKPHIGWTVAVTKTKLATPLDVEGTKVAEVVSKVIWTANAGQGIAPGQFDEFDISGGFLPKADTMVFKALQTYSDGTVVRWIEAGHEAAHPAPVLTLAPAAGEETHSATPSATPTVTASAAPLALAASESADDSTAKALGGAGLGVGVLGLLLGGVALVRTRKA